MLTAAANASARMTGRAQPIPGPVSPEESAPPPEESAPPEACRRGGAVASAAAAVAFPSGPSFSRRCAVVGETRDSVGRAPVRDDSPAPDPFPVPDEFGPPVGRFPPTPGMLSWYWSTPEFPGATVCALAAAGRARASRVRVMTIPRTPDIYGSTGDRLTGPSGSMLNVRINRCHGAAC